MMFDLPPQLLGTQAVLQGGDDEPADGKRAEAPPRPVARAPRPCVAVAAPGVRQDHRACGRGVRQVAQHRRRPSRHRHGRNVQVRRHQEGRPSGQRGRVLRVRRDLPMSPSERRESAMLLMQNPAFNIVVPANYEKLKPLSGSTTPSRREGLGEAGSRDAAAPHGRARAGDDGGPGDRRADAGDRPP